MENKEVKNTNDSPIKKGEFGKEILDELLDNGITDYTGATCPE